MPPSFPQRPENAPRARGAAAIVAVLGLLLLAGCGGSSKPSYCSDRTNLENSIKGLANISASSGISGLQTQAKAIESDATTLVNSAKSDFPTETGALKSSVDGLQSALKSLPSSPSAAQIAATAAGAASVVNSVASFIDATKSKCS